MNERPVTVATEIAALVHRTRQEQGLPRVVEDQSALGQLGLLLAGPKQEST
jgi:hypothetical protein